MNPIERYNTPERRRLEFLWAYCNLVGLTRKEIASAIGRSTEPAVAAIMKRGDISLKNVFNIIASKGNSTVTMYYEFRGETPEEREAKRSRLARIVDLRTAGRLDFLWLALNARGITKTALAKEVGVSYYTVTTWQREDDIMISRLHQIAAILDANLVVEIKPSRDLPVPEGPKHRYTICVESSCPVVPPIPIKEVKKRSQQTD